MKDRNRTAWFIMIASVVMLFWFVRVQADEPAPGTPTALHESLMRAAERGEFYTPTRIQQPTLHRENVTQAPIPRFSAPHPPRVTAHRRLRA